VKSTLSLRIHLTTCIMAAFMAGSACGQTIVPAPPRRCWFIGRTNFSDFTSVPTAAEEIVLTSTEITIPVSWDELIVSWNVPPGVYLTVEARAIFPGRSTKFYNLGSWSDDPSRHPRASGGPQTDGDGIVKTDTLVLTRHGGKVQIRLTLGSMDQARPPHLKFLGLSFCDSEFFPPPQAPDRAAWGKVIPVPERRQAEYGDEGWCSPTSLSMVLAYWGETLHRPELIRTVPEVAAAINDTNLPGTGNWPFNTAYAGTFPGLRACVGRLDDLSELEAWVAAGIPVVMSVSSYLTNDRHSGQDNGHLIVCCGFTATGDVVANDPGVSVKNHERARRVYPRQRVISAWKKSKNAIYLIFPETFSPLRLFPQG
jgi:hypothetical protein